MTANPSKLGGIDAEGLDQLFFEARTYNGFDPEPLPEALLRRVYETARWGPTSANVSPARFVFVTSPEGKEKLSPHLSSANRAKTMAAPCCVIAAYDMEFAGLIPRLFPSNPGAAHWFGDPAVKLETAFRNGSLQGGYLIMAARALGLDCGPMSGFNNKGVDEAFFAGASWRSNFLCNLGYGLKDSLFPRGPRLEFDEACRFV
jgi:nitroreductase